MEAPSPKDLSHFEVPAEHAILTDLHHGSNGKFIIHIQDAHSNVSGQENIAEALKSILPSYDVRLVLSEGGYGDCSLTPMKRIAPTKTWQKVARRFLITGELQAEEYVNLTTDLPMRIIGLEDPALYEKGLRSYRELAERREAALRYLEKMRRAAMKVKSKFYPKDLLDFEAAKGKGTVTSSGFEALMRLSDARRTDLSAYPTVVRLKEITDREHTIDFEAAQMEQATLAEKLSAKGGDSLETYLERAKRSKDSRLAQHSFLTGLLEDAERKGIPTRIYSNLTAYREYLEAFSRLDMAVLVEERSRLEEKLYAEALTDPEQTLIRSIDLYLGLLEGALEIRMTSAQFDLWAANAPEFSVQAVEAVLNRKLVESGYAEDIVPFDPVIDEAMDAIRAFYGSVDERDAAFMRNMESALRDEKQDAAVLISGGYHTEHLTEILREKGYGYVVLTPIVDAATSRKKYEKLLLEGSAEDRKTVRLENGASKKKSSKSALVEDLAKLVEKKPDTIRPVLAKVGFERTAGAGSVLAELADAVKSGSSKELSALFQIPLAAQGARLSSESDAVDLFRREWSPENLSDALRSFEASVGQALKDQSIGMTQIERAIETINRDLLLPAGFVMEMNLSPDGRPRTLFGVNRIVERQTVQTSMGPVEGLFVVSAAGRDAETSLTAGTSSIYGDRVLVYNDSIESSFRSEQAQIAQPLKGQAPRSAEILESAKDLAGKLIKKGFSGLTQEQAIRAEQMVTLRHEVEHEVRRRMLGSKSVDARRRHEGIEEAVAELSSMREGQALTTIGLQVYRAALRPAGSPWQVIAFLMDAKEPYKLSEKRALIADAAKMLTESPEELTSRVERAYSRADATWRSLNGLPESGARLSETGVEGEGMRGARRLISERIAPALQALRANIDEKDSPVLMPLLEAEQEIEAMQGSESLTLEAVYEALKPIAELTYRALQDEGVSDQIEPVLSGVDPGTEYEALLGVRPGKAKEFIADVQALIAYQGETFTLLGMEDTISGDQGARLADAAPAARLRSDLSALIVHIRSRSEGKMDIQDALSALSEDLSEEERATVRALYRSPSSVSSEAASLAMDKMRTFYLADILGDALKDEAKLRRDPKVLADLPLRYDTRQVLRSMGITTVQGVLDQGAGAFGPSGRVRGTGASIVRDLEIHLKVLGMGFGRPSASDVSTPEAGARLAAQNDQNVRIDTGKVRQIAATQDPVKRMRLLKLLVTAARYRDADLNFTDRGSVPSAKTSYKSLLATAGDSHVVAVDEETFRGIIDQNDRYHASFLSSSDAANYLRMVVDAAFPAQLPGFVERRAPYDQLISEITRSDAPSTSVPQDPIQRLTRERIVSQKQALKDQFDTELRNIVTVAARSAVDPSIGGELRIYATDPERSPTTRNRAIKATPQQAADGFMSGRYQMRQTSGGERYILEVRNGAVNPALTKLDRILADPARRGVNDVRETAGPQNYLGVILADQNGNYSELTALPVVIARSLATMGLVYINSKDQIAFDSPSLTNKMTRPGDVFDRILTFTAQNPTDAKLDDFEFIIPGARLAVDDERGLTGERIERFLEETSDLPGVREVEAAWSAVESVRLERVQALVSELGLGTEIKRPDGSPVRVDMALLSPLEQGLETISPEKIEKDLSALGFSARQSRVLSERLVMMAGDEAAVQNFLVGLVRPEGIEADRPKSRSDAVTRLQQEDYGYTGSQAESVLSEFFARLKIDEATFWSSVPGTAASSEAQDERTRSLRAEEAQLMRDIADLESEWDRLDGQGSMSVAQRRIGNDLGVKRDRLSKIQNELLGARLASAPYDVDLVRRSDGSWAALSGKGRRDFRVVQVTAESADKTPSLMAQTLGLLGEFYTAEGVSYLTKAIREDDEGRVIAALMEGEQVVGVYDIDRLAASGNIRLSSILIKPAYRGTGAVDILFEDIKDRVLAGSTTMPIEANILRLSSRVERDAASGTLFTGKADEVKARLGVISRVRVSDGARLAESSSGDATILDEIDAVERMIRSSGYEQLYSAAKAYEDKEYLKDDAIQGEFVDNGTEYRPFVPSYRGWTMWHESVVAVDAIELGRAMGLSDADLLDLALAAMVHDIGKTRSPFQVVNWPGRLSPEQMEIMKRHVADGLEILKGLGYPEKILQIVSEHHERMDGKGYPSGHTSERLSLLGRILAVADTFTALRESRFYRMRGMTPDEAFAIVKAGSGTYFDPKVVAALEGILTRSATPEAPMVSPARAGARLSDLRADDRDALESAEIAQVRAAALELGRSLEPSLQEMEREIEALANGASDQADLSGLVQQAQKMIDLLRSVDPTGPSMPALVRRTVSFGGPFDVYDIANPASAIVTIGKFTKNLSPETLEIFRGEVATIRKVLTLLTAFAEAKIEPVLLKHEGELFIDLEASSGARLSSSPDSPLDQQGFVRMVADMDPGAQKVVVALLNALLAEKTQSATLRNQAITDALTGLKTRRFFDEVAPELFSLSSRYGFPVSVLAIDLDHFKTINDRFGHAVGDQVLRYMAGVLTQLVDRKSDLLMHDGSWEDRQLDDPSSMRWGGEEFLVILPGTNLQNAELIAKRIRMVLDSGIYLGDYFTEAAPEGLAVTASIGVAEFKMNDETSQELIARADAALYEAKEAGRNTVRVASGARLSSASGVIQGQVRVGSEKFELETDEAANASYLRVGDVAFVRGESATPAWSDRVRRVSIAAPLQFSAYTAPVVAAVRTLDLKGRVVEDLGTGSGVLALTALIGGARRAVGIDAERSSLESAKRTFEEAGFKGVLITRSEWASGQRSVPEDAQFVLIEADLKEWVVLDAAKRQLLTGASDTIKVAEIGPLYSVYEPFIMPYVILSDPKREYVLGGFASGDVSETETMSGKNLQFSEMIAGASPSFGRTADLMKAAGHDLTFSTFVRDGRRAYTALIGRPLGSGARLSELPSETAQALKEMPMPRIIFSDFDKTLAGAGNQKASEAIIESVRRWASQGRFIVTTIRDAANVTDRMLGLDGVSGFENPGRMGVRRLSGIVQERIGRIAAVSGSAASSSSLGSVIRDSVVRAANSDALKLGLEDSFTQIPEGDPNNRDMDLFRIRGEDGKSVLLYLSKDMTSNPMAIVTFYDHVLSGADPRTEFVKAFRERTNDAFRLAVSGTGSVVVTLVDKSDLIRQEISSGADPRSIVFIGDEFEENGGDQPVLRLLQEGYPIHIINVGPRNPALPGEVIQIESGGPDAAELVLRMLNERVEREGEGSLSEDNRQVSSTGQPEVALTESPSRKGAALLPAGSAMPKKTGAVPDLSPDAGARLSLAKAYPTLSKFSSMMFAFALAGQAAVVMAAPAPNAITVRSSPVMEAQYEVVELADAIQDLRVGAAMGEPGGFIAARKNAVLPRSEEMRDEYTVGLVSMIREVTEYLGESPVEYDAKKPVVFHLVVPADYPEVRKMEIERWSKSVEKLMRGGPIFIQFGRSRDDFKPIPGIDAEGKEAGHVVLGVYDESLITLAASMGAGVGSTPKERQLEGFQAAFSMMVLNTLIQRLDEGFVHEVLDRVWNNVSESGAHLTPEYVRLMRRAVDLPATLKIYPMLAFRVAKVAWEKALNMVRTAITAAGIAA